MRNVGIAVQSYTSQAQGQFPPTQIGNPQQSWRLHLIPHLEKSRLFEDYHFDLAWSKGENRELASKGSEILLCPDDVNESNSDGLKFSTYAAVTGTNAMMGRDYSMTYNEVTEADGLATTIMISEAEADDIIWNEPRDIDFDVKKIGIETGNRQTRDSDYLITSMHNGLANVIFADCRGRHIWENIDPEILKALCTATGGEKIGLDDF